MDGPAPDPRLGSVQRVFAPTRLSNEVLTGVYDQVFQVRFVVEEVSEARGTDLPARDSSFVALTGGQHV